MGNHDYRDEEDRVMTVRAEIDAARRKGKRNYLRGLPASGFTVDDIALLLSEGSVYQQRLGCHVLSEYHEREYDRMMTAQVDHKWPYDLNLSDWEVRTQHRRQPCKGHCSDSCSNCNLFICAICHGSEGSLLPYCPDRRLTGAEDAKNYEHYCAGTGPFAKASFENLTLAKDTIYDMRLASPGFEALYHAVWHLWNITEAGPLPVRS